MVGKQALQLDLPQNMGIHNVISKAHLVPTKAPGDDPYRQAMQLPPPDIINSELEYKVEQILSDCLVHGRRKYLVHYKGYSPEDDYKYNSEGLGHCQELLEEYCARAGCNSPPTGDSQSRQTCGRGRAQRG